MNLPDGAYFFRVDGDLHIVPLSHKDKKHDTFSPECWCCPTVEGDLIIHHEGH
jgi:hypothetical protein